MIALRVGYEDAEILATHFRPSGPNAMAPRAFSDLSQYEAWARIGTEKSRTRYVSQPCRALRSPMGSAILSFNTHGTGLRRSREVMERKINQWMQH